MPFLGVLEFLLLVKRLQGLGQRVPRTRERLLRAPHACLFRFFVVYAYTVKNKKEIVFRMPVQTISRLICFEGQMITRISSQTRVYAAWKKCLEIIYAPQISELNDPFMGK